MAFDIDADKPEYDRLFPEYRCYEVHDALDIPRPLVHYHQSNLGQLPVSRQELRW